MTATFTVVVEPLPFLVVVVTGLEVVVVGFAVVVVVTFLVVVVVAFVVVVVWLTTRFPLSSLKLILFFVAYSSTEEPFVPPRTKPSITLPLE